MHEKANITYQKFKNAISFYLLMQKVLKNKNDFFFASYLMVKVI